MPWTQQVTMKQRNQPSGMNIKNHDKWSLAACCSLHTLADARTLSWRPILICYCTCCNDLESFGLQLDRTRPINTAYRSFTRETSHMSLLVMTHSCSLASNKQKFLDVSALLEARVESPISLGSVNIDRGTYAKHWIQILSGGKGCIEISSGYGSWTQQASVCRWHYKWNGAL